MLVIIKFHILKRYTNYSKHRQCGYELRYCVYEAVEQSDVGGFNLKPDSSAVLL